ncbi:hypothetical protein DERF_011285 [Dermatophagoides farinae]|uniref:Uncharacterized protein n=1 Tax=Dermatophagoides farinae TaxID=6954 RepID=A0A922KZ94_DERFA|nr:hypothetical protein DERF_011285 [Dermatophagoides farinae]
MEANVRPNESNESSRSKEILCPLLQIVNTIMSLNFLMDPGSPMATIFIELNTGTGINDDLSFDHDNE